MELSQRVLHAAGFSPIMDTVVDTATVVGTALVDSAVTVVDTEEVPLVEDVVVPILQPEDMVVHHQDTREASHLHRRGPQEDMELGTNARVEHVI
jgi:hypothetical protein